MNWTEISAAFFIFLEKDIISQFTNSKRMLCSNKQQPPINEMFTTMITLHTSILNENLSFNGEDIKVKSISVAWNKIWEIRNNIVHLLLEGTVLKVTCEEGQNMSRILREILFKMNAKRKMQNGIQRLCQGESSGSQKGRSC